MAFSEGSVALGAILGIAGLLLWQHESAVKHPERQQITMASKVISDAPAYVQIEGSIAGKGIGYPNNSITIACSQDDMLCRTGQVEQIGENQLSTIHLINYPVTKWDEDEIVATDGGGDLGCNSVTINIERKSETIEWVQAPINMTKAMCAKADPKLYRWEILGSPFWRRMVNPNDKTVPNGF